MQENTDIYIIISYGWLSLLPSFLAIGMALVTRQAALSLFLGLVCGAWVLGGGGLETLPYSLFAAFDTHIVRTLVPEDGSPVHISILLFTLAIGGMVGLISANGGMRGVVRHLARFAHTRRRGEGATAGLGLLIFFDEYASTLIVGSTMRPLTDHLKISREKLAFLVNATAAPVASIAMFSAWFAFQSSLVEQALPEAYRYVSGFDLLLAAVSYSFYPLLLLLFLLALIVTGRDFGAMLKAERRAQEHHVADHYTEEGGEGDSPAMNGIVPILALIFVTFYGLWVTGEGETLREIVASSNSFHALLWGALAGLVSAFLMSLAFSPLSFDELAEAMERGLYPMLGACMVLTLSWAMADVSMTLKAPEFIISLFGDGLSAAWLPLTAFLLAALVAFATGTGWGTMGLLMPVILPVTVAILQHGSLEDPASHPMLLAAVGGVVSGAVFGRHCSPISDTAVLASLASGCPHIRHVITQLPYALLVAGVTAAVTIPVSFGLPWWAALAIGGAVLAGVVLLLGRRVESGVE